MNRWNWRLSRKPFSAAALVFTLLVSLAPMSAQAGYIRVLQSLELAIFNIFGITSLAMYPHSNFFLTPLASSQALANSSAVLKRAISHPYKPSDLPEWDYSFSAQLGTATSDIDLTGDPGREADIHSFALNFNASNDRLSLTGQLRSKKSEGTGASAGWDTEEQGLLVLPSYAVFRQEENGVDLWLHGFVDISRNEKYDNTEQKRYAKGLGFSVAGWTSFGGLNLTYMYSHDSNSNNEIELTGHDYINLGSLSLKHILPLKQNLVLTTSLNHVHVEDMMAGMDDSTTDIKFDLSYKTKNDLVLGMSYMNSFDGYEREGINFTLGRRW